MREGVFYLRVHPERKEPIMARKQAITIDEVLEGILSLPGDKRRDRVNQTLLNAGSPRVTLSYKEAGYKPLSYYMTPEEQREYLYKAKYPETAKEILSLSRFVGMSTEEIQSQYAVRVDGKEIVLDRGEGKPSAIFAVEIPGDTPQEDTEGGDTFSFDFTPAQPTEEKKPAEKVSVASQSVSVSPVIDGTSEEALLLSLLRKQAGGGLTEKDVRRIVRSEIRKVLAQVLSLLPAEEE